jgi:hypothetical protein
MELSLLVGRPERHIRHPQSVDRPDGALKLRSGPRQRLEADQRGAWESARGKHGELASIGAGVDHGSEFAPQGDRLVLDRGSDAVAPVTDSSTKRQPLTAWQARSSIQRLSSRGVW